MSDITHDMLTTVRERVATMQRLTCGAQAELSGTPRTGMSGKVIDMGAVMNRLLAARDAASEAIQAIQETAYVHEPKRKARK